MLKKKLNNNKVDEETTLLHLKQEELKDITLLDINYRTVISFSLIGDEIPLLIKLSDIKYREVRNDLEVRGSDIPVISTLLFEEGSRMLVESVFNFIEWEAFDLLEDDYYKERVREIENRNTRDEIQNRYIIDKEIKNLETEIIYNLKSYIIDKILIDNEIQAELMSIYNEIKNIQHKMLNEFIDVIQKIMNFDDEKAITFSEYFTVMLKTSIVNNNNPIFPENIGKAFTDFSYREVKLRISFEHKETMLNSNRMKVMLPIMQKSIF